MDQKQFFLLVAAIGLTPIALTYGAMPRQTLPWLFGIPNVGTNEMHIFRAMMGLYLALAALWATGSLRRKYRQPALWSLVVFMLGLAAGRALSIILHGWPHWLPVGISAGGERLRRGGLAAVAPG